MVIRLLKENLGTMRGRTVSLAPMRGEDAEAYCQAKYGEARRGGVPAGSTQEREEAADRIRNAAGDRTRYDFLVTVSGNVLGEAALSGIDWGMESGRLFVALFRPEDPGMSVEREAADLLLAFAFDQLCLHRVESEVLDGDLRAQHIRAELGFRREGVRRDAAPAEDGGYRDTVLLSLLEQEYHACRR